MNNIEKAKALINCFATGDAETAASLLKEDYIQHDLAYGTGRDAFVGSVKYLGSAPVKTTVETVRAFEDGDKVFMHNIYNFAGAGRQVAFDVFRFEDGLIAEHWDNLAAESAANPSGRTQTDGATEIKDLDKTEENREIVKISSTTLCRASAPKRRRIISTATIISSTIPLLRTGCRVSARHSRRWRKRVSI